MVARGDAGKHQQAFWDKLRSTGITCGAFHGPLGDRPHLQNWNDAGVSMVSRLAVLLTRSGSMKWTPRMASTTPTLALAGAGLRGNLRPNLEAESDGRRRHDPASAHCAPGPWRSPTRPGAETGPAPRAPTPHRPGTPGSPSIVNDAAEVAAMRQALQHQFDLAEAHWQDWTAH